MARLPCHVGNALISLIVDAIGAEAQDVFCVVVKHIAAVVASLIDWRIVARNAVLKHSRTGEQFA